MSRPPRPHPLESTGREQAGDLRRLDYLPIDYAGLLQLEEELAADLLRRAGPVAGGIPQEGDFGRTFMELSALVAHVLAVYQRRYAGEAFLSTAEAASSLVRHARRLAYEPDGGVAATGFAVLTAKPGLAGSIPAGFGLASAPLGESEAQDYETRGDLIVDAALNEIEPAAARRAVTLTEATQSLRLEGIGHGLEPQDVAAFVGPVWERLIVASVEERAEEDLTIVHLTAPLGRGTHVLSSAAPPRLLAHPRLSLRPFGADADPTLFPPDAIKAATDAEVQGASPRFWYEVRPSYSANDLYLSGALTEPLVGTYALRLTGSRQGAVLRVNQQRSVAVTVQREEDVSFETFDVTITTVDDTTFTSELTPNERTDTIRTHLSRTVTAIGVMDDTGRVVARSEHPVPADWVTDWNVDVALTVDEPNNAVLDPEGPLELDGLFATIGPGRPLVFVDRGGARAQAVIVNRVELAPARQVTTIWWDAVDPTPVGGWRLGDLKVFGNVARVSHGRTVEEALGSSDGVTPFQRFALRHSPLTMLPGRSGPEPALEVRVADVAWTRVDDFAHSRPQDRHYRVAIDETRVAALIFGDGRTGAIPPSGDRNVRAVYRIGLGTVGDVEPRRLSRIKRAHPLLEGVTNVTSVRGGAEPAVAEDIRRQATRFIRTFGRAVSDQDLADLALLFGGIARAAARSTSNGLVLVVATAAGATPPDLRALRAFLDARRDATLPLAVRGPEKRGVHVGVTVEPDPAYLYEIVDDAVRAALHGTGGLFTFAARDLGQPAYLSELYERLEAVAGVVGVRIERFDAGAEGVVDVIEASVEQWLSLDPNDLTVTRTSELA